MIVELTSAFGEAIVLNVLPRQSKVPIKLRASDFSSVEVTSFVPTSIGVGAVEAGSSASSGSASDAAGVASIDGNSDSFAAGGVDAQVVGQSLGLTNAGGRAGAGLSAEGNADGVSQVAGSVSSEINQAGAGQSDGVAGTQAQAVAQVQGSGQSGGQSNTDVAGLSVAISAGAAGGASTSFANSSTAADEASSGQAEGFSLLQGIAFADLASSGQSAAGSLSEGQSRAQTSGAAFSNGQTGANGSGETTSAQITFNQPTVTAPKDGNPWSISVEGIEATGTTGDLTLYLRPREIGAEQATEAQMRASNVSVTAADPDDLDVAIANLGASFASTTFDVMIEDTGATTTSDIGSVDSGQSYDHVPPALVSAEATNATTVVLTFDKEPPAPNGVGSFTMRADGSVVAFDEATDLDGDNIVVLTFTGTMANGEELRLDFTGPGLVNEDGIPVANFTNQLVTNSIPAAPSGPTYGDAISIDLGTNGLVGSQTAGVVAAANWQNLSGSPNFSASNLNDSNGSATTADLTLAGAGGNSGPLSPDDSSANYDIFDRGVILANGGTTLSFAQIPYAKYDVFLYIDERVAQDSLFDVSDGITTKQITSTDSTAGLYAGSLIEDTNYLRFEGLTSASLTLTASRVSGDGGQPFVGCGIQIVERTD